MSLAKTGGSPRRASRQKEPVVNGRRSPIRRQGTWQTVSGRMPVAPSLVLLRLTEAFLCSADFLL
jgi:hypothetical protein